MIVPETRVIHVRVASDVSVEDVDDRPAVELDIPDIEG